MIITPFNVAIIETDTHLSKWILEHGRLDITEGFISFFKEHIPEGGIVFDVGASLGDHSATYSNFVGPKGWVHAFEPNPPTFACLKHNMQAYPNVVCHAQALGDKPGWADIKPNDNIGMARVIPGYSIPVDTIDAMFPGLERLDFMKIDAEGYEPKILEGAKTTLANCRPVMLIEVNRTVLALQGSSAEALYAQLESLNYKVQPCESVLSFDMEQIDVLCLPR